MSKTGTIDRRTLLTGAAVLGGASVLAVGAANTALAGEPQGEPADEAQDQPVNDDTGVPGYMCSEDWLGEAPVIDEADISEVLEADVVVCGSGHAGTQAALAAAQLGASVIVLESQYEESYSCFAEDICSYNSELLTSRGIGGYDLGEITGEYVRRGAGRVSAEIIRKFVDNSGEMLDNLVSVTPDTSNVFDFDDNQCQVQIAYDMPNGSDYPLKRNGFECWAGTFQTIGTKSGEVHGRDQLSRLTEIEIYCIDAAKELGAEWLFNTEAVVLVQNDAGDVTGVIGHDVDTDTYVQVNANKGVILATGDFGGNPDMVYNLLTDVNEVSMRGGATRDQMTGAGRDGTGLKMGCWAGGMIESQPRPSMNTGAGFPGPWGSTPFLVINALGKRFMNEGWPGYGSSTIVKQPLGLIAVLMDKNYMDNVKMAGLDHGAPNWGPVGVEVYGSMDRLQAEMEACVGTGAEGGGVTDVAIMSVHDFEDEASPSVGANRVYSADTLEELLGYLGYEGEALETALATIDEYNAMCDAGVDSQYGKDPVQMIPIKEPPFFGAVTTNRGTTAAGLVTLAGLVTNDDLNVLKMDRTTPIKGLYAAGNCLGQRYGIGYSTPSAGSSLGMALTHGRVCGKIVASL